VWLAKSVAVGDLIFVGSAEIGSWVIQKATSSDVSHVALVVAGDAVVESYDYTLWWEPEDEGLHLTRFEELFGRTGVNRIVVRRPEDKPPDLERRLENLAERALENSPFFPSAGAALTGVLVALVRWWPGAASGRSPSGRVSGRLVSRLMTVIRGSGRSVHCSEFVTRMYIDAGLDLEFSDLVLGVFMDRLEGAWSLDGKSYATERRYVRPMSSAARSGYARSPARRPVLGGPMQTLRVAWQVSTGLARVLRRASNPGPGRADFADFVLPADLLTAGPFVTVGAIEQTNGQWFESKGGSIDG
jgi:hypothetical protein